MGRGGLGGSSDRMRAVEVNARVANRALEATRPRTASIFLFFGSKMRKNSCDNEVAHILISRLVIGSAQTARRLHDVLHDVHHVVFLYYYTLGKAMS